MNPRKYAERLNYDELRRLAMCDVAGVDGTRIAAARGVYNERRAVMLLREVPGVRSVRRGSEVEDRLMATDVVVETCDARIVRLQIKSRQYGGRLAEKGRLARERGAIVVRIPIDLDDETAKKRLRNALGVIPRVGDNGVVNARCDDIDIIRDTCERPENNCHR